MSVSNEKWRSIANWLRIAGFACCFAVWASHIALLAYYAAHRPVAPQSEHGMTVGLTWTHPTRYGTGQDERRSQWLFDLFLPSFGLIVLGEMIRIYKLNDYSGIRTRENPPWNHRWGPWGVHS